MKSDNFNNLNEKVERMDGLLHDFKTLLEFTDGLQIDASDLDKLQNMIIGIHDMTDIKLSHIKKAINSLTE